MDKQAAGFLLSNRIGCHGRCRIRSELNTLEGLGCSKTVFDGSLSAGTKPYDQDTTAPPVGKGLDIAFPIDSSWCLVEHDESVKIIGKVTSWLDSSSWTSKGQYHSRKPSGKLVKELERYILVGREHNK